MYAVKIKTKDTPRRKVELDAGHRIVFGRSPECDVILADLRVSREHFVILVDESGELHFEHLNSKNPVYLNGFAREAADLSSGDVLTVGDTTVRVTSANATDSSLDMDTTSVRRVSDSRLASAERFSISALDTEFPGGDDAPLPERLQALYQLSEVLVRSTDLDTLFGEVLKHALKNLPGQRGFIAIGDPQQDQFEVVKVAAPSGASQSIDMSDTILEEIQMSRESFLVRDAKTTLEATVNDSIQGLDIEAFMCTPMLVHDEFFGLIYVDQRGDAERPFERHDLQYLQSTAHLLALAIDDRLMREQLQRENLRLREVLRHRNDMIATSPAMTEVIARVSRAAPRESSVVILGETGTGKECIAKLIHDRSPRRDGPFIAFNCALSSPALIESELFGHRRGAFTGAGRDHRGKFELANGGTLLLDEIGDMPLDTQVKLLRAIQERKVWPVGSEEPIDIDIRLVAATHRDLDLHRRQGKFRDDLFYRIAVLTLELPPLRDRGDDILAIAENSLPEEFEIDPSARKALLAYSWPGNIRELQNAMEHASFNAPAEVIRLHDLPAEIARVGRRDRVETRIASISELESRHIRRALEVFGGNKKRAAEALGISRETLYQKIKTYGL